jgi:fumarylacetoacetate (FAA) hydrolase family protein
MMHAARIPQLLATDLLPTAGFDGVLVARLWVDEPQGPRPVAVRAQGLYDLSALAPTMSELFDLGDCAERVRAHAGERLGSLQEAIDARRLLAPCDLQAIKAAGVTFVDSLIERVIEERARGAPQAANALRARLMDVLGSNLAGLQPGSPAAEAVKKILLQEGVWSQYLEVGIGPDPEIFTKAQPMSSVGSGALIGLHPQSAWNNPEPEIVLAVSSDGRIVGACLGNDVNLRDFEGRSALLLGKAKDNNASCAIGPFVRLFDAGFTLDDVKSAEVHVSISGADQFHTEGTSSMSRISRTPEQLVAATIGATHQYPDGLMLFLGTMYVPTADRSSIGGGFTHHLGDIVRISSPRIGALINVVTTSEQAPPWTFGVRALMASLAARGLLR